MQLTLNSKKVSKNKRQEAENISSCRIKENEVLHTQRMEKVRTQIDQRIEAISAKMEIETNTIINNNLKRTL